MICVTPLKAFKTVQVKPTLRDYGHNFSILWSDSADLDELHAFAARITLSENWFLPHKDPNRAHYFIDAVRRERAVKAGAAERGHHQREAQIEAGEEQFRRDREAAKEAQRAAERERKGVPPPAEKAPPDEEENPAETVNEAQVEALRQLRACLPGDVRAHYADSQHDESLGNFLAIWTDLKRAVEHVTRSYCWNVLEVRDYDQCIVWARELLKEAQAE